MPVTEEKRADKSLPPSVKMSPSPPMEINDGDDDMQNMAYAKRGCCFLIPCMGSSSPTTATGGWWERMPAVAESKEPFWSRGWKRIREWSEVVAGPKWKTFIRRFNRNNHHHNHRCGGAYGKLGSYQYDASSYALNFDDDNGADDNAYAGFSSRYASVPSSAKASMDLGKDGPTFT